jgi:hypothetical protein
LPSLEIEELGELRFRPKQKNATVHINNNLIKLNEAKVRLF